MPRVQKKAQAAQRNVFLKAFAQSGIIGEAARLAGVGRRTHYNWLADPEYQRAFDEANEEAADRLEAELYQRIFEGTPEPLVWQGELQYAKDEHGNLTDKPLMVRRKNDTLLIFALKGVRPERYRDNWKGELNLKGDMQYTQKAPDLSKLTDEQLKQLDALARAATGESEVQ